MEGNTACFGNGAYLMIVDISDPSNPIELGKTLVPGTIQGVAVSGSYAYVADGSDGLRILDCSVSELIGQIEYGQCKNIKLEKMK